MAKKVGLLLRDEWLVAWGVLAPHKYKHFEHYSVSNSTLFGTASSGVFGLQEPFYSSKNLPFYCTCTAGKFLEWHFKELFLAPTPGYVLSQHLRNYSDLRIWWLIELRSQRCKPPFLKTRHLYQQENTKHEQELVARSSLFCRGIFPEI